LHAVSRREIEILEILGRGYGPKAVARQLSISYETVRSHQKNIYRKLGVNSLVQALVVFRRETGIRHDRVA
jgi:DNA-binding CsgD family transcriptional regulator